LRRIHAKALLEFPNKTAVIIEYKEKLRKAKRDYEEEL